MSELKDGQSPLNIVTNPDNYVSKDKVLKDQDNLEVSITKANPKGMSRRDMLKFGGTAAAAVSVAASGVTGFRTGRSADAYVGWGRTAHGEDMFFNRDAFRTEVPVFMEPVGEVSRPHWTDMLLWRRKEFFRVLMSKEWTIADGYEKFPGQLGDYYRANPERYQDILRHNDLDRRRKEYWFKNSYEQYAISAAYANAYVKAQNNSWGNTIPEDPEDALRHTGQEQPPEKWDYRNIDPSRKKMEFKSPAHASELIKKMAHLFGASIVGITKFDTRFMFTDHMRGMKNTGHDSWGDKVPSHWKSIIVFGTPMYWDSTYAAIGYSTSADGYFKTRVVAGLLENFLQQLGHPARAQAPGDRLEIMFTPYVMLSGIGEFSRSGMAIVPELGSNFRPGAVITDIEFEYDKPIDINVKSFCRKCKICAETCPSGAIPTTDEPETVVRGFKRWLLDEEKCYDHWIGGTTIGGDGCRVCIAVCPYTRKNTWIHKISREVDPRDPTGLFATGLLTMQQNFFKYPAGEEFRSKWNGGREATYHNPPDWERTEDFFKDIDMTWEYEGMY